MLWGRKAKAQEAGKAISSSNMEKVQGIHDMSMGMGADCAAPIWGGVYESARIWEAALPMSQSHDALRGQLRDALKTAHGVSDIWMSDGPYVHDVFPNHVVYSHGGQTYKRGYTATHDTAGGVSNVSVDSNPKKVHTAYVDSKEGKESMAIITDVPADYEEVRERFIAKGERDKADPKDFAGKHKSFPILEPGDVKAALDSIGRAGADNHNSDTLKSNILRIAKRKGFAIPKSDSESAHVVTTLEQPEGELVTESSAVGESVFCFSEADITRIQESGRPTKIPIKIIQPGWGASGYYPKEVLQRDGPQVFKEGLKMFWNHPTDTQEAERPEGDMSNLAGILSKTATWNDNGPKGPGLYAEAKVFSDYSQQVAEKGAHTGISIRAYAKAHEGEAEGKVGRIFEKLTHASSVDFVTRPGAGGASLVPVMESERRSQKTKETTMTPEEIKAIQDRNVALEAENAKLKRSGDVELAVTAVSSVLKEAGISISEKIVRRVCAEPLMKEGKPDTDWVKAIALDFVEESTGVVRGMGGHQPVQEAATREKEENSLAAIFQDLGMTKEAAAIAVKGVD